MTRYAPLPSVSIDPRNEAQLVQQASQRVYEASNQTLNDFSSGNPLAALLEGLSFSQGEFLFWANQLPQKILVEWIGPFLGAMRRLGTASTARLTVTIPPSDTDTVLPVGTTFSTNQNLTGGTSISFITSQQEVIPAGQTTAQVTVSSQFVGSQYNCAANTIVVTGAVNVPGLTATNPQPAVGGSDVETFDQVQSRFFSLIRRRNPVSAEDWRGFFLDFYGDGTYTSVQPNRPNQGTYNYLRDYLLPNGQVSFFVLGPNGQELTQDQLERGQTVVNFSVPVENQAHLYPMTLSQVQYDLTVEVDANGPFGGNLKDSSLNFRDRLFEVLRPGNVFPVTVDPTVSDADAAFYSTFDATVRFIDPHITSSSAYNTPALLEPGAATYTQVYSFAPSEYLYQQNGLVVTTTPSDVFYPVLQSFTPYSAAKTDQVIYGNLQLRQIKLLTPGQFLQGDVVYWSSANGGDNQLHVVLSNLVISTPTEVPQLIATGRVSAATTYTPWSVGSTYQSNDPDGTFNPQIVQYDYAPEEFVPAQPSTVSVTQRPGTLVWVTSANFTLAPSTNSLAGAQSEAKVGSPVTPAELTSGDSYTAGTWVFTPQVGSGPTAEIDPYYYYVDVLDGAVVKYAYVVSDFTYNPDSLTVSAYFDTLVEQGIVKEIVVKNADNGLSVYKYSPRFPVGTYLEYRADHLAVPEYFIAATYFTPNSTRSQDLVNEGLIIPLATTSEQRVELASFLTAGTGRMPVRMFTFFAGDRTFFRQGSRVLSYTATTNVTPLFAFYIYTQSGVFVISESAPELLDPSFEFSQYVPYFDPAYSEYAEDTILSEDGKNLYRVMRAFTPLPTVVDWTGTTVANTARIQEYAGNLLRYVNKYVCEEPILSQLGRDVSAIKLGVASITVVPKNSGRFTNNQRQQLYVWENASTLEIVPQLSWYTGTSYPYSPPQYRDGTMRL